MGPLRWTQAAVQMVCLNRAMRIKKTGAMWGSSFCETAFQYRIKYKPIKDLGYLTETKILKEEKTLFTIMIITPNVSFASIFSKIFQKF